MESLNWVPLPFTHRHQDTTQIIRRSQCISLLTPTQSRLSLQRNRHTAIHTSIRPLYANMTSSRKPEVHNVSQWPDEDHRIGNRVGRTCRPTMSVDVVGSCACSGRHSAKSGTHDELSRSACLGFLLQARQSS